MENTFDFFFLRSAHHQAEHSGAAALSVEPSAGQNSTAIDFLKSIKV
jgi:hypothetical protein